MVQIIKNIFSSNAFAPVSSSRRINAHQLNTTIEYFFLISRGSFDNIFIV